MTIQLNPSPARGLILSRKEARLKTIQPDNFTSDRPYWYVECTGFTFRSNLSLDDALRRWSMCGKPTVLCCGSVG